jgi:hypothetical protein
MRQRRGGGAKKVVGPKSISKSFLNLTAHFEIEIIGFGAMTSEYIRLHVIEYVVKTNSLLDF